MKFKQFLNEGNLYRWSNLGELSELLKGKRRTTFDVTSNPNFYFSPFSSRFKIGKGWISDTYIRVVLDSNKLKKAGWIKDPSIKGESALRPKGLSNEKIVKEYKNSIKKIEIHQMPSEVDEEDIKAWIKFRFGKIPVEFKT